MPEIQIRPATREDLPYITGIDHSYKSSYVWQMDLLPEEGQLMVSFREIRLPRAVTVDYPRNPERIETEWDRRTAVLVGLLEGTVVGYLSISENISPTTAWITDMAVLPEVRRKGIASGLLIAANDWAGRRRNRRIILEVQSKNHPAIRMAQKLGYEFCGYNDHYYENQDIALFFAQYLR